MTTSTESKPTVTEISKPQPVKNQPMAKRIKGKIVYIQLEGGFYGIVSDLGKKILPLNLPEHARQEGAEVEFSGVFVPDQMTIQQWGTPFKIKSIEVIKPGKPNPDEGPVAQ